MKTITFFNEKGGVGKTTFAIMYASWLHYIHGVRVAVVDFNDRLVIYRNNEIRFRKKTDSMLDMMYKEKMEKYQSALSNKNNPFKPQLPKKPTYSWERVKDVDVWPIFKEDINAIYNMKKTIGLHAYTTWFKNVYSNELKDKYDVVILDFPGNIEDNKYKSFIKDDLINLTVIPVDKDIQTIASAMRMIDIINHVGNGRRHCEFLNQINLSIKTKENNNTKLMDWFKQKENCFFLPDIVSFSERMKKISEIDIMRSTFEYPTWGEGAFKDSEDIGIDNLFIDITRILVKCEDILDSTKTDLSFVDKLQKKPDQKRQLTGSSFPEFEI